MSAKLWRDFGPRARCTEAEKLAAYRAGLERAAEVCDGAKEESQALADLCMNATDEDDRCLHQLDAQNSRMLASRIRAELKETK